MPSHADTPSVVIPAKAGIHLDLGFSLRPKTEAKSKWMTSHSAVNEAPPAFAGMTALVTISSRAQA
jgi:hypothetical protein